MNITDVGHLVDDGDDGEDKMLVAARREKKRSTEIAQYYTDIFFQDCEALNIQRPNVVCKATEHIPQMIKLIERLMERGYAYLADGNVYFDVAKLADYGRLARLDLSKLQAGARIEVDTNKRGPFDFVLWFTKSKFENHELLWDSPWGKGYPGWHIECSAMAMHYLGEEFDIHCGGIDHVPVHHTNEIAQSEGAIGHPWVKYWIHSEFLVFNNLKMSKSAGGFLTVSKLKEAGFEPIVYRWLCLGAHYRTQLSFSWDALEGAKQSYESLKRAIITLRDHPGVVSNQSVVGSKHLGAFEAAVNNDLNTAQALAAVWGVVNCAELSPSQKLSHLTHFDKILGLGLDKVGSEVLAIPVAVQELLTARNAARASKEWAESDRLRAEILKHGFGVEDKGKESKLIKL